ncbi:MAG: plasmid mobilization protein [Vulcanimicrobiaceae bacterium]
MHAAGPPASSRRAPTRRRGKQLNVRVTEEEHTAVLTRAGIMTNGDVGEFVRRRCLGQRLHANVGGHAIRILMRIARTVAERYPADREFHDEIISAIEAAGLAANL